MLVSLTILSLISTVLVLIPLTWHWRAGNVAIVCMIIWLAWTNLTLAVDTIVWADNVIIHSRIWCDIVTKTWIGFQVAFPVCTFCITFYLEKVASIRNVLYTAEDKRRRQITEGALCIGVPVLIMILHVIVQGHRFDIVENTGCSPSIYNSWQSFLIIQFPPFVFALLCLVYAVLALRWFIKRRAQFSEHLESSRSGMNGGRYARLMGFAVTQIIFFTVVWSWMYVAQIQSENWRFWDNWANVHSNFGRIAQFPKILLPQSYWNRYYFNLHVIPIVSIFFFVFFGFGQEAMNEYRRIWRFINKYVFRREVKPSASRVLPTFSAPSHVEFSRSRGRTTTNNDVDSILDDKWPYGTSDDVEAQSPTKDDKEAKDISGSALVSPPPFSNIVLTTDRQDETSSTASSSRIRRSVDGAA